MLKGRSIVLCVLLFAPALMPAQQASTLSVDDLVRIGLERNKDIAASREGIAEASGLKRQAGVRPAPDLTLKGASGKPLGTIGEDSYGADITQEMETFGKRSKRIAVAGYDVDKAEVEVRAKSAELAYEIRVAVADRRAAAEKLALLQQLSDANREALHLTEARVHEGDAPALEANLLKVEIAKTAVRRNTAQGQLDAAENNLRRLIGFTSGEPLPEIRPDLPTAEPLQVFSERALQVRTELRTARFDQAQAKASIDLAAANAKPDVNFGAGYIRQTSQFEGLFGFTPTGTFAPLRDRDDILSFSVSIPLKNSRDGRGGIDAAMAKSRAATFRRESLERSIPLEVEAAYRRLQAAQASVRTLDADVIPASTKNLDVIREAYKSGELRLLDVINEQRQVVESQLASIEAQAEIQHAWAGLQRAAGGNLP